MVRKPENADTPSELSGEDLDMAVGGATAAKLSIGKAEEQKKRAPIGEQHRKMDKAPSEEKIKHQ